MSSTLFQENAVIFGLRGGNMDFLKAQRVVLQSIIDQVEEVRGLSYQHEPFSCDLYWTSLTDSNDTVGSTSVVDFSDDLKALLIEARTDIENLMVSVRRHDYAHNTNFEDVYKSATVIMNQALKQFSNYVKLVLTPYTDHAADSNDLSLFPLDSNVFSSPMASQVAVQDALDASTLVAHSRYYYSEADSNTFYRKSHIGNMNMQSLRTFKRIVESLKGIWPRASVILAQMNGKYAGSDMVGTASPIQSVAIEFSEFLNYVGSLTAVGSHLATELDEYIEAARAPTDGDINYTTGYVKTAIQGFASYFDGDESTVSSDTPITSDLSSKIKDITNLLIADSAWDPENPTGYDFLASVIDA